jgi:HlyD family secretion protein
MTASRLRTGLVWAGVVAVIALVGWSIVAGRLGGPPLAPREADVAHVKRAVTPVSGVDERYQPPTGDFVGGNGLVEPAAQETALAAPVPGRIAKVLVSEGDLVEAGTPLFEFDAAVETAALAAAQADVEGARADLLRLIRGSRHEEIEGAIADTDAAQARAALSAGVLERLSAVAGSGGVSRDELDRATRQSEADRASAASADARRREIVAGARREDVLAAQARVLAAEARRDQASATLARLTVRTPIDAQVLEIERRAGEYYQPAGGEPLAYVGDTRHLRVRMDLDERDIGRVRMGSRAQVRAPAFPGIDFPGHVVEIGRRMGPSRVRTDDPTARTDTLILQVVIALDRFDGLVPRQRVMCYVEASPAPESLPNAPAS